MSPPQAQQVHLETIKYTLSWPTRTIVLIISKYHFYHHHQHGRRHHHDDDLHRRPYFLPSPTVLLDHPVV